MNCSVGTNFIEPLAHAPLQDRLYVSLRKAIMAGQFNPGRKLTVRELAAMFHTSPMPVRAALSRLVAEGGLDQRAGGFVYVPNPDRKTFSQIMELRAVLEALATRKAAANINRKALVKLKKLARQINPAAQKRDLAKYLEANKPFKLAIYEYSGDETLFGVIENLWLKVGPLLSYLSDGLDQVMAVNFHDEALHCLETGDAEAAAAAIARDIRSGAELILDNPKNWEG
ncbi:MAG: GntR family transcriptional regulator [Pseudomonadota bacterium]